MRFCSIARFLTRIALGGALGLAGARAQSSYIFEKLAGAPPSAGSVDGLGQTARFFGPGGVAVDQAGNVYVADHGNQTIRKITPAVW
jgi:DNA-binding beta-propeller fold protein YncE